MYVSQRLHSRTYWTNSDDLVFQKILGIPSGGSLLGVFGDERT